jgi:hypothetical protein
MSMYRVAVLVRTGLAECVLVQWDARGQAWIISTLVKFNIYAFRFPAILCILLEIGLAHDFLSLALCLLSLFSFLTFYSLSCYLAFVSFARFFSCVRVGTRLQISLAKNRTALVTPKFDNGGRKECPHTCSLQT